MNITTTDADGIFISGTNEYFVIQNCYVDAAITGVLISSVTASTANITNNYCVNNNGADTFLIDNRFESLTNNGLDVYGTDTVTMSLNFFKNLNNIAINLTECGNVLMYNCTVLDCNIGLYLDSSNYSEFYYNRFHGCVQYGVQVITFCQLNVFHQNAFIDNAVGYGTYQAHDVSINSTWYNFTTQEGNFWSDYIGTGNYSIDGGIYFDLYPLLINPVISEMNKSVTSLFMILFIFFIPTMYFIKKKRRRK